MTAKHAKEPLEEIPWSEEEDVVTRRIFDRLDKKWSREEARARGKTPAKPPPAQRPKRPSRKQKPDGL